MPRYHFSDFTLSPRRRLLLRNGQELPLIPRYFDLLVFLVDRRHEAVHRRDIFDRVWSDVVVSDSALSQAIRTLRRTLGEDPREPRFIRTVSRHGYQFVCSDVVEEDDDAAWPPAAPTAESGLNAGGVQGDAFEQLLERVTRVDRTADEEEERREAAELLHALGTAEALRRLGTRPGHARARALLRDTRWESPTSDRVPVLGAPAPLAVTRELLRSRLRRAGRAVAVRWAGASAGGAVAGMTAGVAGGLILTAMPTSATPLAVVPVLAAIGGVCGAIGGAGVGAGVSIAEATARSHRPTAIVGAAAIGGAIVGVAAQWLARWMLALLFGLTVPVGGGVEGLVLGGSAGLGYAIATRRLRGGLGAPRGRRRLYAAALTAVACGLGAFALTHLGRPLVGGTLNEITHQANGAGITLAPLGRLLGEPDFGPVSQALLGTSEGAIFGFGLALGLTRRPSSRTSHETLTPS